MGEEEANGVEGYFYEGHAKSVFGILASRRCDRIAVFLHFGQGEAFIGDDEVAIAHQALRGEVMPKSIASVVSACCECVDAEEEDEEMGCGGSVSHWQLSDKRSDSSRRHRGLLKAAIQKVFYCR